MPKVGPNAALRGYVKVKTRERQPPQTFSMDHMTRYFTHFPQTILPPGRYKFFILWDL
jgi:hypothetical protein